MPKTRLDKVVAVRERKEEAALAHLARARATLEKAHQELAGAIEKSKSDARGPAQAEYWQLEEAAHARALEALRSARQQLASAATSESEARTGYVAAHREAQAVRRAAERKRSELRTAAEKTDQKQTDELATQGFNNGQE